MEVVITTTFNVAGLAESGGLRAPARSAPLSAPSPSSEPTLSTIRPCALHPETVEGYKRGGVVARYLWSEAEHAPQDWWTPRDGVENDNEPTHSTVSAAPEASVPRPALELVLGRDSHTCDVVVPLRLGHGPLFSRKHCALRVGLAPGSEQQSDPRFGECMLSVIDFGSRNGTFVNSVRAAPTPSSVSTDDAQSADQPDAGGEQASQALFTTSAVTARFHPTLDNDIATGVSPLLTLSFGTGAAVPIGGELPDAALRLRLHVYVRVLWRTASWELRRQLMRPPQPRLASLAHNASSQQTNDTIDDDDGQTGNTTPRPRSQRGLDRIEGTVVMRDWRGHTHTLRLPDRTATAELRGSSLARESSVDDATQDDDDAWLNDMRHAFQGDQPRPTERASTSSIAAPSGQAALGKTLREDCGLQWWVYQLGGRDANDGDDKGQASEVEQESANREDEAHRDNDIDVFASQAGSRPRSQSPHHTPEARRTALNMLSSYGLAHNATATTTAAATAARALAHAVVAQQAAIREDGLVHVVAPQARPQVPQRAPSERRTSVPVSPSASPSPARQLRVSMASLENVEPLAPGERFSHVLPHSRGASGERVGAPNAIEVESSLPAMESGDVVGWLHAAMDEDDDDAPVLVRSRRASGRHASATAATTRTSVVEFRTHAGLTRTPAGAEADADLASLSLSPPPPADATLEPLSAPYPSPSRTSREAVRLVQSTECLSSQPPARRSVSIPVWRKGPSPHGSVKTEDNGGVDSEEDEDVIEVALTPPPEPSCVTVVADDDAARASRHTEEGGPTVVAGGPTTTSGVTGALKSRKRLSKAQQKAVDASETIRRFMQELQGDRSSTTVAKEEQEVEPLSPLFTAASVGAKRSEALGGDNSDRTVTILTQLQHEVSEQDGLHAHVVRRRRAHKSDADTAPSAASSAGLAKVLATTLKAGLALGRTRQSHEDDSDEDDGIALGEMLSLPASAPDQQDARPTTQLPHTACEDDVLPLDHAALTRDANEDGRRTTSTTHLSPRVSFEGAHARATTLMPAVSSGVRPGMRASAEPLSTWCVFIATQAPSAGETPRRSHRTRASHGDGLGDDEVVLGQEVEVDGDESAKEGSLQRRTLHDVLSQHLLLQDESDHVDAKDSTGGHWSQYSAERAWILSGAGVATAEASPTRHSYSDTQTDALLLFRLPPHSSSAASSRRGSLQETSVRGKGKSNKTVAATTAAASPLPALSQLMSLDVQAYLLSQQQQQQQQQQHDMVTKKTDAGRATTTASSQKRKQSAHTKATPNALPAVTHAHPLTVPQLCTRRPLDATAAAAACSTSNLAAAPVMDAAGTGEMLAGLPLAMRTVLYPHQQAALRVLWRMLLAPAESAGSSSGAGSVTTPRSSLSSLLAARVPSPAPLSSSSTKRGSQKGYRPLITVADIADILSAHHPPRLMTSRSRTPPLEVSASQLFGHHNVDQRASQLSTHSSAARDGGGGNARTRGKRERDDDNSDDVPEASRIVLPVAADSAPPRSAIVAHTPGLGKTVTTIAFLMQLWAAMADEAASLHDTAGAGGGGRALPQVFRSRADGGRGGLRIVLCVPKPCLIQWTRALDAWLAMANDAHSSDIFVLHQEDRRHAKAREAMLQQWAGPTTARDGALLLTTHTLLTGLLLPDSARQRRAARGAPTVRNHATDDDDDSDGEENDSKKSQTKRKARRTSPRKMKPANSPRRTTSRKAADTRTTISAPAPSTDSVLRPPQETFWVDEMSDGAPDASSASVSSKEVSPSRSPRPKDSDDDDDVLGGALELTPRTASAAPKPLSSATAALAGDDGLALCERNCQRLLLNHTTLLILDGADQLSDTWHTRRQQRRSTTTTSTTKARPVSLSDALTQFPQGTVRVALSGRLPSLLSRAKPGSARAWLCGLLRFVRPDCQEASPAELIAHFQQQTQSQRDALSSALPGARLRATFDFPVPAEDASPDVVALTRSPSAMRLLGSPSTRPSAATLGRTSAAPWYALPALRGSRRTYGARSTGTGEKMACLTIDECRPTEVIDGALPTLVETTLVFDLSPVQAVLLRELVRDLSTTHASRSAQDDTTAVQKASKPVPASAKKRKRRSQQVEADAGDGPSSTTQLVVLPPAFHLAFTTYALYISNQCDLVRDWCQRQGIDANSTVHDVEAHEQACADNPARRVRWAIPSLLTPSVFDTEARCSETPSQGLDQQQHDEQHPVCLDALGYSWKMRGLFFLLHVALARGEKVLVFSHSLKTLILIAWLIDHGHHLVDGVDFALVSGALSPAQRDRLYTTFNDSSSPLSVLLLTFDVARSGIDLHRADRVVLFDTSRSVETEAQAVTRAYRLRAAASPRRPLYVNRLLSNEPVEIESIPMDVLQSLALQVLMITDRATDSATTTNTTKGKTCQGQPIAGKDATPARPVLAVRDFVVDVARLDLKTGFSAYFASLLTQQTGLSRAVDSGADANSPPPRAGSPQPSSSAALPLRTLSRALASTGVFAGMPDLPPPRRPSRMSTSSPSPRPTSATGASTASSPPSASAHRGRRRARSATPPPPPLTSRREGDDAAAVLEAFFQSGAHHEDGRGGGGGGACGLSPGLCASLPSLTTCTTGESTDDVPQGTSRRAADLWRPSAHPLVPHTAAVHSGPARYVVPAIHAYLQIAEERRRRRCAAASSPTEAAAAASASTCADPVVVELAAMETVREMLALHFHESRIWNMLNGTLS